jgi:hypothetical protein
MIKPLESKWDSFLRAAGLCVMGFVTALVVLAIIFLKVHWTGFMKFVTDPYFFDHLEVSRDYQLKK